MYYILPFEKKIGNVLLEAKFTGSDVVVLESDGPMETIVHGFTGIFVLIPATETKKKQGDRGGANDSSDRGSHADDPLATFMAKTLQTLLEILKWQETWGNGVRNMSKKKLVWICVKILLFERRSGVFKFTHGCVS